MFPRPAVWSVTDLPMPGLEGGVAELRAVEDAGARARPRCSATCRSRVWPRRSRRRATGQIRALFTVAGNPVLSTPGGDRLDAALAGLDCMISVDNWLNETTRHADVILPGLSPLEQPHHDDLIWNFAVGSAANYSPAIFPPDGRPARGVGDPDPARRRVPRARTRPTSTSPRSTTGSSTCSPDTRGFDGPTIREQYDHGGPVRMLDLTLRTGPFGDRYGERPTASTSTG